jgi:uncharacterized protein (DUF2141 family)
LAILPLLLIGGAAVAAQPAPAGPAIEVSVAKLRNAKGQLLVCLTSNAKAFPDCSKDPRAIKRAVPAASGARFTLHVPANGTYAIALVHDENSNDKMDLRLFLPREGFGFSNNPKIGMGAPGFKSCAFAVTGDRSVAITMKYML